MKKCYIAGKIGDLPESVYLPLFEQGEAEVHALGYEPISPTKLPHAHSKAYGSFMREDIREMLKEDCVAVYALRNWRHSPGAIQEINTAIFCGLDIIQQPPLK